jgi:hypothetical protein
MYSCFAFTRDIQAVRTNINVTGTMTGKKESPFIHVRNIRILKLMGRE